MSGLIPSAELTALPSTAKMTRRDLNNPDSSSEVTLLGINDDIVTR